MIEKSRFHIFESKEECENYFNYAERMKKAAAFKRDNPEKFESSDRYQEEYIKIKSLLEEQFEAYVIHYITDSGKLPFSCFMLNIVFHNLQGSLSIAKEQLLAGEMLESFYELEGVKEIYEAVVRITYKKEIENS